MQITLYGVFIINEDGQPTILAATSDEDTTRTELFPQLQSELAQLLPVATSAEARAKLVAMLASMKVVIMTAEVEG